MTRRLLLLLAVPAAAFVLAACGGDGDGGGESLDPATLVPANAPLYGEVTVRPEGETKEAVESIVARFPGGDDPERAIRRLLETIDEDDDELLQSAGEWVGDRVGFFTTDLEREDVPIGLVFAVKDRDQAKDALREELRDENAEEETAGDVTYNAFEDDDGDAVAAGFVEDALVFADQQVFERIAEDAGEDGLAGRSEFDDARGEADDALGFVYLDSSSIEQALEEEGVEASQLEGVDFDEPTTAVVDATQDRVTIDVAGPLGGTVAPQGLFERLPGGSVAALSLGDLESSYGALLKSVFQAGFTESAQEDGVSRQDAERVFERAFGVTTDEAFGAFGQIGAFARVGGITDFGAALVAQVRNAEDARRTVRAARRIIDSESEARVGRLPGGLPGDADGFSVRIPGFPFPLLVALNNERLVVAIGERAATEGFDPERTVREDGKADEVEDALGEGFEATGFVDLEQLVGLTGPLSAFVPEIDEVRRYLEPLELLATGSGEVDGNPASRTVIRFGGE